MIRSYKICTAASFLITANVAGALADEHELKFRLVTYRIDLKVVEVPNAENHLLGTGNFKGVAVFEDGEIADKTFVYSFDESDGVGTGHGYSTYTFLDGSSISARFDDKTDGNISNGEYTVLGGTGRYDGAKGTGWYKKADEPWDGASLFDGGFELTLP